MSVVDTQDALQGNLREFPLAHLLIMLANRSRSGVLAIDGGSELWYSQGRIYLATTPRGAEIRKILCGAGVGTVGEIDAMFESATWERTVLDQIFEIHPEAEPILNRLLHEHTINSLFELFALSGSEFRFEMDCYHPLGDRCAQDTAIVVGQAEQRLEIWRRIAARIPSTAAVLELAKHLPDHANDRLVTADDWRYLALLNGQRSVAQVIAETGESAFRVCSTLYRLLVEQVVVPAEHR